MFRVRGSITGKCAIPPSRRYGFRGAIWKALLASLALILLFGAAKRCHAEDKAGSIARLKEKIKEEPRNKDLRKRLAALYITVDKPEKAIEQFKRILEIDPDDIGAKEGLGLEYMWTGHYRKARELLKEVLEKDPNKIFVKRTLKHLDSMKHSHHDTRTRHGHVVDRIRKHPEQLETYKKLADEYLHTSAYEKARQYYLGILELYPGNVRAQRRLDQIERLMKPQVFTQIDFFKVKGDARHLVQTYGGSMYLQDGYQMESTFVDKRRTEPGVDRYSRKIGTIEISKAFTEDLVLFGGGVFKYYSMDEQAIFDCYFRGLKNIGPHMSINFAYEKEHQDAKKEILTQRVDRHGFVLGAHVDLARYLSFNADVEADSYTHGQAPDNNASLSISASPIMHILKGPSTVDLSYTYHRLDFLRKDITLNNSPFEYNYYSPKVLVSHAATLFVSRELFDGRFKAIFSDSFSYRPHDSSLHNMIYTEIRWKLTKADSISGVFVRTRSLWHVGASFQKTQQFTVKFSHTF
ncbi:MAG: hypothetical protein GF409_01545 [Candidatus Omnitrophica bacterium]|nr:hypothetical protein [Candidatus Omnitrophota bacterium]